VKAAFAELKKSVARKYGSVAIVLPPEANANISANTLNGGIRSDFAFPAKKHFPVEQNLDGELREGGSAIKMSSVNGGIRVDHAKR